MPIETEALEILGRDGGVRLPFPIEDPEAACLSGAMAFQPRPSPSLHHLYNPSRTCLCDAGSAMAVAQDHR
jgi:hypothetical protein